MLDEYAVHLSQMHPLGLAKLRHFEYACLSLGFLPESLVFRALYSLVWKAPFFTFDRRSTNETCLRLVPAREMHWRSMSANEKVKDVAPPMAEYQENAFFKALTSHPSDISIIPDGALALVGMSLCWRDVQICPAFKTVDGCKVLQGLPLSGDAKGLDSAAPGPRKIIRIRRAGGEGNTKSQPSRAASPADATTAIEAVKVHEVSVATTTVDAPIGPPLKRVRTVMPQLTNFEARRRGVLAGIVSVINLTF
ncbi:hypothetical protein Hanom_Chr00s000002g01600281 [Helianthus anomalus]